MNRKKISKGSRQLFIFTFCCLISLALLSCAKSSSARFTKNPHVEYVNGSKIIVNFNESQNKTFYYHNDIHFAPQDMNGIKADGKHSFDVNLSAAATGKYTTPDKITFSVLHNIAKKSMWRFPKNTAFAIEADGKRILESRCVSDFDLGKGNDGKCLQNELQQDSPDTEYYDALFFDLPLDEFRQLSNARDVSVKIDKASFNLNSETIASIRAFAAVMSEAR